MESKSYPDVLYKEASDLQSVWLPLYAKINAEIKPGRFLKNVWDYPKKEVSDDIWVDNLFLAIEYENINLYYDAFDKMILYLSDRDSDNVHDAVSFLEEVLYISDRMRRTMDS